MRKLNRPTMIDKALHDQKCCRDWLMPHMALGKPKAFTKKHYHQLALAELGPISRAAFDDGWIWAIEDSQRPDWYNPKRRSKLLRHSRL